MINFISTMLLLFSSNIAIAFCDFNVGNYLNELDRPQSITDINIKVAKVRNFTKNFYKIIISENENISPKLKKKFNAKLTVNYNFGKCIYDAKVWQNGDWKDHVGIVDGMPSRSLNVKMITGNILNSVKFKLLIPKTRNDLSEIFATVLLRELGFITPETFKVNVSLNGNKSLMIFQEDSRKEMLERNGRREGPIIEGDETLIWTANGHKSPRHKISLTRLVNKNWFLKGEQSAMISLKAMQRMQNAYLINIQNSILGQFIQPNVANKKIFNDYSFFMLAMHGSHGLSLHNRKFYYNSFIDDFEPIYYDGDIKIEKNLLGQFGLSKDPILKFSFTNNYKIPKLDLILSDDFKKNITTKFKEKNKLNSNLSDLFAISKLEVFKHNIQKIQEFISSKLQHQNFNDFSDTSLTNYISRVKDLELEQEIVTDFSFNNDKFFVKFKNNQQLQLSQFDLAKILSNLNLNDSRVVFLSNKKMDSLSDHKLKNLLVGKGDIYHSSGISIKFDQKRKIINIYQKEPTDWILFSDFNFDDLLVKFTGNNKAPKNSSQRFNKFGLTGCLNIYNSTFNNTTINIENGGCEDSLNIVNSSGNIYSINVQKAYSDGVDIDFSNLSISNLTITHANNDCFDVSGGTYNLNNIKVTNCMDKGVSVGEKSEFFVNTLNVYNSNIGISSKDFSQTVVRKLNASSSTCYEAFQKKQEFGGAYLKIDQLVCNGKSYVDGNSVVLIDMD